MIIYKDLFTGDELCTDSFKPKTHEEFECIYVVKAKYITQNCDIDDALIGGNKSAEGGCEDVDASSVSGLDLVLSHKLCETGFGKKKEYQIYIKDYMKKLIEKVQETDPKVDLDQLKKQLATFVKHVLENFDNFQFFQGEKMDPEGMILLLEYKDEVPYFYLFKQGLEEEKV